MSVTCVPETIEVTAKDDGLVYISVDDAFYHSKYRLTSDEAERLAHELLAAAEEARTMEDE